MLLGGTFFIFPKIEGIFMETCFEGVEAIKRVIKTELGGISEEPFQKYWEA